MMLLLTILKTIGIILLIILCVLLFVLLLVLLVPIRYRLDASVPEQSYTESEKERMDRSYAHVNVSWLLHLISVHVRYPIQEDSLYVVRLLGFRIFPPKEAQKENEIENDTESKTDHEIENDAGSKTDHEIPVDTVQEAKADAGSNDTAKPSAADDEKEPQNTPRIKVKNKPSKSLAEKLESAADKIRYTISCICGKIDAFDRLWNNVTFQEAFALIRKRLLQVLKAILPRRFRAYLHIGTGDPASMADLMMLYGILYPAHRGNLMIAPEFDEKIYDGYADIKGRIYLFRLLYLALTVILSRRVRISVKRIRKLLQQTDCSAEKRGT